VPAGMNDDLSKPFEDDDTSIDSSVFDDFRGLVQGGGANDFVMTRRRAAPPATTREAR
jgi:hypothetical protein